MSRAGELNQTRQGRAGAIRAIGRTGPNYRRLPLLAGSILALLAGLWAGLQRLGWNLPVIQPGLYAAHGPLMVAGFLGTVISLERAVAIEERWSYAAPVLSAVGAVALITGAPDHIGALLITVASLVLVAISATVLRRQTALFTVAIAAGAVAWLVGNFLWLIGTPIIQMFSWWVAFLVLTIAGERLELSRFAAAGTRRELFFAASMGVLVAGLLLDLAAPAAGLRLEGAGILLLVLWLWGYDLARRTVRQRGLTRFMAVNLLGGYFWLGVGALTWLWFGDDLTAFHFDAMLHAIFLGFVFSMIFAHAPVIFPAVLQSPLPYRRAFYFHSALLHLSLVIRIGGDLCGSYASYQWGGMLNVAAVVVFVGNTVIAIISGISEPGRRTPGAMFLSGSGGAEPLP
jgi:hypothetical protein